MKKFFLIYIGVGLVLTVVFNLVLLVISLAFGFEDSSQGPTLIPSLVFAAVMGSIVYLVIKALKPKSLREALTYSLSWTAIVLVAILVITIANDTTEVFFGKWFDWLVFVTMGVSPALLSFSKLK